MLDVDEDDGVKVVLWLECEQDDEQVLVVWREAVLQVDVEESPEVQVCWLMMNWAVELRLGELDDGQGTETVDAEWQRTAPD